MLTSENNIIQIIGGDPSAMKKGNDYTVLEQPGSIVINIEAVYKLTEFLDSEASRELQTALDTLRAYGSAEIVRFAFIANDFNTAAEILHSKRVETNLY